MIYVDYLKMDESLKDFILSTVLNYDKVVDSLLKTINLHLDSLDSLNTESLNAQLHFDCSVEIINKSFSALFYINYHSANLFSGVSLDSPLRDKLDSLEHRFTNALERIKKEVPIIK